MGDLASSHWDAVSKGYADFVGPIFESFMDRYIDRLQLAPEMKVLDLACGPGTASMRIRDRVASVDGLDYSPKMIETFNETIQQSGTSNIQTHVGDGQDLSRFEDGSFDIVISLFGLIFFPDRLKALKEIKRVLKPHGRILISSWPAMDKSSFMTTLFQAIESTGCMPPPKEDAPPDLGTPDPEVFRSEFQQAQFRIPLRETALLPVPIADVDTFWEQNARGSIPLHMIKKELGDDKWNEVNEKALAYLRSKLRPPCSLELQAWVWLT